MTNDLWGKDGGKERRNQGFGWEEVTNYWRMQEFDMRGKTASEKNVYGGRGNGLKE